MIMIILLTQLPLWNCNVYFSSSAVPSHHSLLHCGCVSPGRLANELSVCLDLVDRIMNCLNVDETDIIAVRDNVNIDKVCC